MKKNIVFADFETTQPDTNNIVEVYLWALVSGKRRYTGTTIEEFYNFTKNRKDICYFHNLKFDFSYLQYYLIKNNITYKLLEKKGIIYSVSYGKFELRDSMNFMPMSLKEVGLNYCTKHQKSSIEHLAERGHIPSAEEIEYCVNDCLVLQEGFTNYMDALGEVLELADCTKTLKRLYSKMTNAGIAYSAFKELSPFEELCPKTTQKEFDLFREAYKGGYVYSAPRGIKRNIRMIDANSMYPYIYANEPMPYGKPVKCDYGDKFYNFYILKIHCCYELREGYIPIIGGGIGKWGGTEYKTTSNGEYEELIICSIDLEMIKEFYDIDFEVVWCYGFKTKPYFFKEYADTFIAFKNQFSGVKRAVSKVLLNSPYGKTAMNGLNEIKNYYIDETTHTVKSEKVGFELDETAYQYLPIAIAITAGARRLLLTTAKNIGFDKVQYMDTDSIKFEDCAVPFEYDANTLGAWKDEGLAKLFKTLAPKKYITWDGDTLEITCAGFNKSVLSEQMHHKSKVGYEIALQTMHEFTKGLALDCLQSKIVEGGRALLKVKKEIK